ncbi:O-methyltransferase involved in polyketide biosynthesis [Murinocardiopsis flavida]|uniref:O-methyltransferase involved in polyketide biosynthesis n=1 Tax=Murinocardiopsis flavida TaxID=645275 RepID=A0A2P8CT00_9ACTN|nr:class I SAM-dependent methyltransferase [Murinocardiopsis flavida]PSK88093.1 O-methyltransferase involved in polyketide biosynthesis [Murinocardiopsis flavida]
MEREKISLTGAPATMLATLYARALDNRLPVPVLGDTEADRTVRRIDYDFGAMGIKDTSSVVGVALRAKYFDDWTTEFLAAHPDATVLHLACGLDTRVHRIAPPASVRWIDVDYPDVIRLRERLLPDPGGDYRMVASSVTDDAWLDEIPADRPTVAVFEGLSMYLTKDDGKRLIQRITGRLPSGQLLFDCYGTVGVRMQKLVPAVRNTGAILHWGVGDPHEIEGWHEGLVLLDTLRSVELPGNAQMTASARAGMWVMARIPGLRDIGRLLRFSYT